MCKLEFVGQCVLVPVHAEEEGKVDYKVSIELAGSLKAVLEILSDVGLEICIIEQTHSSVVSGEFSKLILSLNCPDKEFEYIREFDSGDELHFIFPKTIQYVAYSLVPFIRSLQTTVH